MKSHTALWASLFSLLCAVSGAKANENQWAQHMEDAKTARQAGRYADAERHYHLALDEAERSKISDIRLGNTFNDFGLLCHDIAKYKNAEMYLQAAVGASLKNEGKRSASTARSLNNLGALHSELAKYANAELLFKTSLAIVVETKDVPDLAVVLNNLAQLYHRRGNWQDAETHYTRAKEALELSVGDEHPQTATAWNNLGVLYRERGRYADAIELFERARKVMEKAHGPNHPQVAGTINNIAKLYLAQGAPDKAAPLCKQSLDICEKSLGGNHPHVATCSMTLAKIEAARKNLDEANKLCERAAAIRKKSFGSQHPKFAEALTAWAELQIERKDAAKAEDLCKEALTILDRAYGEYGHPSVAQLLETYATLLRQSNRGTEATEMTDRAKALQSRFQ